MKIVTCIILLSTLVSWKFPWSDEWKGFLYPSKSNLSSHIVVGKFESLEDCRNAVKAHSKFSYLHSDYECGLNCKPSKLGSIDVCEKTLK